jgi:hypothetical protein
MKNDIEYMGHSFYVDVERDDIYKGSIYFCRNCNINAFIQIKNLYAERFRYYKRNGASNNPIFRDWPELDITCDEYIIKNIIE